MVVQWWYMLNYQLETGWHYPGCKNAWHVIELCRQLVSLRGKVQLQLCKRRQIQINYTFHETTTACGTGLRTCTAFVVTAFAFRSRSPRSLFSIPNNWASSQQLKCAAYKVDMASELLRVPLYEVEKDSAPTVVAVTGVTGGLRMLPIPTSFSSRSSKLSDLAR